MDIRDPDASGYEYYLLVALVLEGETFEIINTNNFLAEEKTAVKGSA